MIKFVNAKINIGLNVVSKRPDGYHNLSTVFYPVGLECGTPHQPDPFDDILEVTADRGPVSGCRFQFVGRRLDCTPQKNLVVKAATLFLKRYNNKYNDLADFGMFEVTLDKHLPDGAGLGGGSADAAFTLSLLNEFTGANFSLQQLKEMSLRLGADCPFFLVNTPCYASGVGEELLPIELNLQGYHILIVKPDISISTAEAFRGVTPSQPDFDLQLLPFLPIEEWKEKVKNDFEKSVFPYYPELAVIKNAMYESGAIYASMSGSGSAIYGIYRDYTLAHQEREQMQSTYQGVWLFGL